MSATYKNLLFWLSRIINYPFVSPDVIQISLTYRCNLRCKMCSIAGLLPQEEELSTEQIFHIIDEAKSYKIKEIVLTGGEPFLREDIFKICEYSYNKGIRSIITTNGVVIDNDTAETIVKSKVSHIHFSLDGLEETNDFFRGEGVFKKVIDAIDILNEKRRNNHSFSIGIAYTVLDNNVKELSAIVKLADDLNVDVINFQPLISNNANFLDKSLPPFWVKEDNIPVLKEEIEKIRNYKLRYITIYEEPRLELLVKYYQGKLTKKDWVCFGGFKTVFVCYSKKEPLVYSCHGICGDLDKISLKKAWESEEAYKLRLHSKNCKNLCMQACYSQEAAQSLSNLVRFYIKKIRREYIYAREGLKLFRKEYIDFNEKIKFYLGRIISFPLTPVEHVYFSLTNRCNLRCKMCDIPREPSRREDELTTSQIKDIILQIKNMGIKHLIVSGGEPFLREDLFEILEFVKANNIEMVDIITNGLLLNSDSIQKLIRLKLNHITISLDGLGETNNEIRGKGVFGEVEKSLDELNYYKSKYKSSTPTVGINFTIMSENIEDILPMIEFARLKKCNIVTFQPVLFSNIKMFEKKKNSLWPSEGGINNLEETMEKTIKLKDSLNDICIGTDTAVLSAIPDYFKGKRPPKAFKCYEAIKRIVITGEGKVWSCIGIYGNLKEEGLKKIWFSLGAMRVRIKIRKCKEHCLQDCIYYPSDILGEIRKSFKKFRKIYENRT